MHFQVLKDREFNHIIEYLLRDVPEFSNNYEINAEDGEYIIFGEFASFIKENIEKGNQSAVKSSFDFINENIKLPDVEVQNLFEVEIFESLIESKEYIDVAKKHLKGKALERLKYIETQAK